MNGVKEGQRVELGRSASGEDVLVAADEEELSGLAAVEVAPDAGSPGLLPAVSFIGDLSGPPPARVFATDHLGTVRAVYESQYNPHIIPCPPCTVPNPPSLLLLSTHDYEPFGTEIYPTDPTTNTHQFTGHERDNSTTGNDYMKFRFFQDAIGRFLRPDNIAGRPSDPQSWNRYSYVNGNPVNLIDPNGHAFQAPGRPSSGFILQVGNASWVNWESYVAELASIWVGGGGGGTGTPQDASGAPMQFETTSTLIYGRFREIRRRTERAAQELGLTIEQVQNLLYHASALLDAPLEHIASMEARIDALIEYALDLTGEDVIKALLLVTWARFNSIQLVEVVEGEKKLVNVPGYSIFNKLTGATSLGEDTLHHVTANAYNKMISSATGDAITITANVVEWARSGAGWQADIRANTLGNSWGQYMLWNRGYLRLSLFY